MTGGQLVDAVVDAIAETDAFDDLRDFVASGVVAAHFAGDEHVLAHGQEREQLESLEGAGHAQASPLVRREAS